MKKAVSILLITFIMIGTFSSCKSYTAEDMEGTWYGSWEYEGKQIEAYIEFYGDKDYIEVISNNGVQKTYIGTYTINGHKLVLEPSGENYTTEYKIKNGSLENEGHKISKQE
ncbi:MAG: hypothetical protein IJH28_01850 [Mogibacterium sp.]|nr:hypothetical protein [Mogibacterium sp.]